MLIEEHLLCMSNKPGIIDIYAEQRADLLGDFLGMMYDKLQGSEKTSLLPSIQVTSILTKLAITLVPLPITCLAARGQSYLEKK